MVGGSARQPPAAFSRVGLATALVPGGRGRRCHGDRRSPSPHPPGRVPGDGTDPAPGVQQRELHGAGGCDFRGGEIGGRGGHSVNSETLVK